MAISLISRSEDIVRYVWRNYCTHVKVKVNGTERTFHYNERNTALKEYLENFEDEDITLELSWQEEFKIDDWRAARARDHEERIASACIRLW